MQSTPRRHVSQAPIREALLDLGEWLSQTESENTEEVPGGHCLWRASFRADGRPRVYVPRQYSQVLPLLGLDPREDNRVLWLDLCCRWTRWRMEKPMLDKKYHLINTCGVPGCVNTAHAEWTKNRSSKGRRGEEAGNAKLFDAEVEDIRKRYAAGGITQTALAKEYGVSQPHISFIVQGKVRKPGKPKAKPKTWNMPMSEGTAQALLALAGERDLEPEALLRELLNAKS